MTCIEAIVESCRRSPANCTSRRRSCYVGPLLAAALPRGATARFLTHAEKLQLGLVHGSCLIFAGVLSISCCTWNFSCLPKVSQMGWQARSQAAGLHI
mgnify:CR=1 FL=1